MRNGRIWPLSLLLFSSLSWAAVADPPAKACASLKQLSLPHAGITLASIVAAGTFVPPDLKKGDKVPPFYKSVPAFCRVVATLKPSPDSDIKVEVWMPVKGWNGRFRAAGNGGYAGYINYWGLAGAVMQGYAGANTDTGHSTTDAEWALGHPEKVIDYGYRAVHEMSVDAKAVIKAFYGEDAKRSYFASCSNGGRQALMEAQRFPDDYDGILAGAPANNWVPMLSAGLRILQTLDGEGYIPLAKIPAINQAVLNACDSLDGLKDGILNDPRQCHFDPSKLQCKDKDKESDACLTAPQVNSLRTIYSGARDSYSKNIYPGLPPGAEEGDEGWSRWITGSEEGKSLVSFFVTGYFTNMVYAQKDWDFKKANIGTAMRLAQNKTAEAMNATDPHLKGFLAHKGKLILYHGWNDPAISALNSVDYFNRVQAENGANVDDAVRLYMVPGMQHCGGGPGATSFGQGDLDPRGDASHDVFTALVEWVENGKAPGEIIATKYRDGDPAGTPQMTRPICPYPQAAKYAGKGDPNAAESFACSK